MPTTNTPGVGVTWASIHTNGISKNVVTYLDQDITLFMGIHVDPAPLLGKRIHFTANFQIQDVETKEVFNHYWNAPYNPIGAISSLFPDFYLCLTWGKAEWAGIKKSRFSRFNRNGGGYLSEANRGDGLYLYRPYFMLHVEKLFPGGEKLDPPIYWHHDSDSGFGVGDENYLMLEVTD